MLSHCWMVARRGTVPDSAVKSSEAEAEAETGSTYANARATIVAVGATIITVSPAVIGARAVVAVPIVTRTCPPTTAPLVANQADLLDGRGGYLASRGHRECGS